MIFNESHLFRYSIGSKGSKHGEFNEPIDITLNYNSNICVADKNNSRIEIFKQTKRVDINQVKQMNNGDTYDGDDSFFITMRRSPTKFSNGAEFAVASGPNNGYVYSKSVHLNDKPVKLSTSAPFGANIGVATESGIIYIINDSYHIISYVQQDQSFDILTNFCLNLTGNQVIIVDNKRSTIKDYSKHIKNSDPFYLYFYEYKMRLEDSFSKNEGQTIKCSKMNLTKRVPLQVDYLPGIKLTKITNFQLSVDSQCLLLFDSINFNLIQYSMNGEFMKILLKGENYLGSVVKFCFSGDNQHLVAIEVSIGTKPEPKVLSQKQKRHLKEEEKKRKLQGTWKEAEPPVPNHIYTDPKLVKRSDDYLFKLKTFLYMNCECHSHLNKNEKVNWW
jgi:hypothetical protein